VVLVIDNVQFATRRDSIDGVLAIDSMARLGGSLHASMHGAKLEANYALRGSRGSLGQLRLVLQVEAKLVVSCQRCLGALAWPVKAQSKLDVATDSKMLENDDLSDDSADWIEADRAFDVAAAVEDELILAIPVAPRHKACPDEATLAASGLSSAKQVQGAAGVKGLSHPKLGAARGQGNPAPASELPEDRIRPFSGLAQALAAADANSAKKRSTTKRSKK
jgi:uncharacterized protein